MKSISRQRGGSGNVAYVSRSIILVTFSLVLFLLYVNFAPSGSSLKRMTHGGGQTVAMYVFAATEKEFMNNLAFFVREGVMQDTKTDYVIAIQGEEGSVHNLPALPKHARYVYHGSNTCYDWGTFGWLMKSKIVDTRRYKHFIFINSSVRGPFMTAHARANTPWTEIFLSKLVQDVKMVGPTINCGASGPNQANPHVQSYAFATDSIGLSILQENGVFDCRDSRLDTVDTSEVGSSKLLLKAGYNIDCLMLRYQGVDWREKANWGCNEGMDPTVESSYDGISADPLEVLFVKVKKVRMDVNMTQVVKAIKYDSFLKAVDSGTPNINTNEFIDSGHAASVKACKVEGMSVNKGCFDAAFYLKSNEDLAKAGLSGNDTLWGHFVNDGQFEMRPHRFWCQTLPLKTCC